MKIVITGGPCNGKTTIINALRKKGYFVVEEIPRKVIIEKQYSRYLDRYKDEALDLQKDIYTAQISKEKDLDKADELYSNIMFLDRGYVDPQVYCKHLSGYIPAEMLYPNVKKYGMIIILERLPMVDDGLRRETDEEAEKIQQKITQAYIDEGYNPIFIPIMSVEKRVKAILEIVNTIENKTENKTKTKAIEKSMQKNLMEV